MMNVDQASVNESNTESDSEFDNCETASGDEEAFIYIDDDFIFSGSNIKLADFKLAFLVLCKRININMIAKNILLEFISTILPFNNIVPCSYTKLIKNLSFNSVKSTTLCDSCYSEKCICTNKTSVSVYEFDLKSQICSIVKKNWEIICDFKSNFNCLDFFRISQTLLFRKFDGCA